LNVPYEQSSREEIATLLKQFGYQGIALNVVVKKVTAKDLIVPETNTTMEDDTSLLHMNYDQLPLKQYKRLTINMSDTSSHVISSTNPLLLLYDIIAVIPQDEKTFHAACTSLDVDIIVVDMSCKLPYTLKKTPVSAAMARGIHFEMSVGPSLRDIGARRFFFVNGSALVRATKGKNLIITNEATQVSDVRAPNDIANMCSLLGMDFSLSKAALSTSASSVLKKGETRQSTRGVLRVFDLPAPPVKKS